MPETYDYVALLILTVCAIAKVKHHGTAFILDRVFRLLFSPTRYVYRNRHRILLVLACSYFIWSNIMHFLAVVDSAHDLHLEFHPKCDPTFKHFPNMAKVIAFERVLPSLSLPNNTIDYFHRQRARCWHPDKTSMHPSVSRDQMKEIWDLYNVAAIAAKTGQGIPRTATALELAIGQNGEIDSVSRRVLTEKDIWEQHAGRFTHLDRYANCTCRLAPKIIDGIVYGLTGPLVASLRAQFGFRQDGGMKDDPRCETCTLRAAWTRWALTLDNLPPPVHDYWYTAPDFTESWNPIYQLVRLHGLRYNILLLISTLSNAIARGLLSLVGIGRAGVLVSKDAKLRWIKQGWYTLDDFLSDSELHEERAGMSLQTTMDEEDYD